MAIITVVDPVSRIEGHMKISIEIDQGKVIDAKVSGTLFRGFENILTGRVPDDAPLLTQRICGVCPVSHGIASTAAIEKVAAFTPSTNARVMRNLVLGANFIQSHILHFYVLCAVDFTPGPASTPWTPAWNVDLRSGAASVMTHLSAAFDARRKAHEMGAIFGAKLPHVGSFIPGGVTANITADKISRFQTLLNELKSFISGTYIPDVQALASVYSDYYSIGVGPKNLMAFGVFDQSGGGKLFGPGYMAGGSSTVSTLNTANITEHVTYSWYQSASPQNPSAGTTTAQHPKTNAYSWIKAPRYSGNPVECGPLARMKISGRYTGGISAMDRHLARSQEALVVANALSGWLGEISSGTGYSTSYAQRAGNGEGLVEAPRGALGHWINIASNGTIGRYQVITPTCWNASPKDDNGVRGPIEQALIGTPITDAKQPIEALRVIHSFDPCLACAVHVMRPSGETLAVIQNGGLCQ
jgi:hydrogenase large subunit